MEGQQGGMVGWESLTPKGITAGQQDSKGWIWGIWESIGPGKPYTSVTQEGLSQATGAWAAPGPAMKGDPGTKGHEGPEAKGRGRDGQRDAGQTDRCTISHKLGCWARVWRWGLGAAHVWVQNFCRCLGRGTPKCLEMHPESSPCIQEQGGTAVGGFGKEALRPWVSRGF